nr:hypothetical protein [uncultured Rhodopila sp.]
MKLAPSAALSRCCAVGIFHLQCREPALIALIHLKRNLHGKIQQGKSRNPSVNHCAGDQESRKREVTDRVHLVLPRPPLCRYLDDTFWLTGRVRFLSDILKLCVDHRYAGCAIAARPPALLPTRSAVCE